MSEVQVSRDECNHYHGVTVEQAQRILEVLGETVSTRFVERPQLPVGST